MIEPWIVFLALGIVRHNAIDMEICLCLTNATTTLIHLQKHGCSTDI